MDLQEYLKKVAQKVNCEADEYSLAVDTTLRKASSHLLVSGGKRLRPAMVLLAADTIRPGASEDVFEAALALEWEHTFTLIHDDIMDQDTMRRGTPTVHTVFGEPTAILAGDALNGDAFSYICRVKNAADADKIKAVQMLAHACHELCEGQQEDMEFETRDNVTKAEYLSMVRKKTGILLASAAGIGAVLAGGDPRQVSALYTLGMNAGIAFQIQDDILDLITPTEVLGKNQASDLRENKQSFVVLTAKEKGIDLSKYHKADLSSEEIAEAVSLLTDAGIIAECRANAEKLIADAKRGLEQFPDSEEKNLMAEMADFFIARAN
ncbi:MAG TPA: polyprenyl synthetase family protein [Methanocorpusculum sp.]|nr:polyprenyl synthetase family protein [Methanocorpusculum sp.]